MAGLASSAGEIGPGLGVSAPCDRRVWPLSTSSSWGEGPGLSGGGPELPKAQDPRGRKRKGGQARPGMGTLLPSHLGKGPPEGVNTGGVVHPGISGDCPVLKLRVRKLGADGNMTSLLTQSLVSLWERKRSRCTWVCTYVCIHACTCTQTQVKPCEGRSPG